MEESEVQLLKAFLDEQARYRKDRERIDEEDKRERREFRDEIKGDIKDLRKEIAPVVRDHRIVMGTVKWVGGGSIGSGLLYWIAKGWNSMMEKILQ